jgi:DNA-binding transcriptional MerR regulator
MYSVSQAARAAGVSVSTIRQWAREFADHLSPGATPPKGQPRQFDEEDIAIFATAAVLRAQLVPYEEIEARIATGERLEPVPGARPSPDEEEEEGQAQGAPAAFSAALQLYDKQFSELQQRLAETQERLLEATERATAAETELRLLRQQQSQEKTVETEIEVSTAPTDEEEPPRPVGRRGWPTSWRYRLGRWLTRDEQ